MLKSTRSQNRIYATGFEGTRGDVHLAASHFFSPLDPVGSPDEMVQLLLLLLLLRE